MSLTRPIPDVASKALAILRADVPRPSERPRLVTVDDECNPPSQCLRFFGKGLPPTGGCCPLGLHPKARSPVPAYPGDLGDLQADERWSEALATIRGFGNWWDEQRDPQAAMDAVWPT